MSFIRCNMLPTGKRAGGAPINFVYHATQSGAEGYAISAIGKDILGTDIKKELDKNHINYSLSTVDYPTGSVIVELKNGIPSYIIIEDVAWDHIPLTQEAINLVKNADAVCFGTLAQRFSESRNTVQALLSYVPNNALCFFDINIRESYYSKELIENLLQKANVFKINDEELELVSKIFKLEGDRDSICSQLLDQYALRYLIFTAGSKFSSVYSKEEISTIETPKVKVVDTVGAGDSFSGAFVYSILTGKNLHEAHQSAVETAAFVCTQNGAWPPYPQKQR